MALSACRGTYHRTNDYSLAGFAPKGDHAASFEATGAGLRIHLLKRCFFYPNSCFHELFPIQAGSRSSGLHDERLNGMS